MEKIKEWLTSDTRDYRTGVFLYAEFGSNQRLTASFMSYLSEPTPYYIEMLTYELNKICPVKIKIPSTIVKTVYNTGDPRDPKNQGKPVEIEAISTSIKKELPTGVKELHKEHSFTHELMRHAQTDEERLIHAHHIMSHIIPNLDALYQGKIPPAKIEITQDPPKSEMSDLEKDRRLRTVIANISKMKNKIASGRTDLSHKMNDLVTERDLLKSQLFK